MLLKFKRLPYNNIHEKYHNSLVEMTLIEILSKIILSISEIMSGITLSGGGGSTDGALQLSDNSGGRALKLHTDTPHLVSIGSDRLSTSVTLHPIPQGGYSKNLPAVYVHCYKVNFTQTFYLKRGIIVEVKIVLFFCITFYNHTFVVIVPVLLLQFSSYSFLLTVVLLLQFSSYSFSTVLLLQFSHSSPAVLFLQFCLSSILVFLPQFSSSSSPPTLLLLQFSSPGVTSPSSPFPVLLQFSSYSSPPTVLLLQFSLSSLSVLLP